VALDRRERDVHDRDVEDDHELRGDDYSEGEPSPAVLAAFYRGLRDSLPPRIVDKCSDSMKQPWSALHFIPMTATDSKTEAQKTVGLPEELVTSSSFLLKRLGFLVKDRTIAAFEESGLSPYHHAVLALLEEDPRETQAMIAD